MMDESYIKASNIKYGGKLNYFHVDGSHQDVAVATRKENKALMEKFNNFLVEYKNSGKYKTLEQKYFSEPDWLKRAK